MVPADFKIDPCQDLLQVCKEFLPPVLRPGRPAAVRPPAGIRRAKR
jgi:hypothetical protein